eukprot:290965_1
MADTFDVTQTQSKLWTPLHIRTTKQSKNQNLNRNQTISPEQTCYIYESILSDINRDNKTLKQLIENLEIEQKCLYELLKDEPHWMGSVNGTQRKLMYCAMNLEIILLKLQKEQTEYNCKSNSVYEITSDRSRRKSNESSQTSSKSKSTSGSGTPGDKPLDNSVRTSSRMRMEYDIVNMTTIKVPYIGITHYTFSVKKVNKRFWSTSARLLHIDLKKKK